MLIRNHIKTLRSFRKQLRDDKYFLYFQHKRVLDSISEDMNSEPLFNYLGFRHDYLDLRSYVNSYLIDKNYNYYFYNRSFINALALRIPSKFWNFQSPSLHRFYVDSFLAIKKIFTLIYCNLKTCQITIKAFTRKSVNDLLGEEETLIIFDALMLENTINSGIPSYLKFCMQDPHINKYGSRESFALNYSGQNVNLIRLLEGGLIFRARLLIFIFKVIKLNLASIISVFIKNSNFNLLLHEHFKKIVVDCSVDKFKEISFVFNNSSVGYTPLWAQGNNRENFLIFYSTNFGYSPDATGKKLLTPLEYDNVKWDWIYVWDKLQQKVIASKKRKSHSKIIGRINFIDSGELIFFDHTKFNIAIFDVTPKKISYVSFGGNILGDVFYTEIYMKKFIKDIVEISKNNDMKIYIKKKRKIKSEAKGYEKLINDLVAEGSLILIDEKISPERIASKVDLVISPVYSTPSYIARQIGTCSLFYDPEQIVLNSYEVRRDVELVAGKKKLKSVIAKKYEEWSAKYNC